jgi:poly(A) polymerase
MFSEWCVELLIRLEKATAEEAQNLAGHVFTFGSYELGVYTSDSDIDCLCVAPELVERSFFNKEFRAKLALDPLVTDLNPIFTAKVPIIKMKYDSVSIDMLFVSLPRFDLVTRGNLESLQGEAVLEGVEDDASIKSLNGCRVTF